MYNEKLKAYDEPLVRAGLVRKCKIVRYQIRCFFIVFSLCFVNYIVAQEFPVTKDSLFVNIERSPEFPRGKKAMDLFIETNLKYPEIAKEKEVTGQVVISFTVDTLGYIKDAQIVQNIGLGCGAEALRVVNIMPKWIPGYLNGKRVEATYNLPLTFPLPEKITAPIIYPPGSLSFIKKYPILYTDWQNTKSRFLVLNSGYSFYTGEVNELLSYEINYFGFGTEIELIKRINLEFDLSIRQSLVEGNFVENITPFSKGEKVWTNEMYFGGSYNITRTDLLNFNGTAGFSMKNTIPTTNNRPDNYKARVRTNPSIGFSLDYKLTKYGFGYKDIIEQLRYPVIRFYSRYTPIKIAGQEGGNLYLGIGVGLGISNLID